MLIEFKCPHCQTTLQDPSEFAGKKSKCPRCKNEVIVPKHLEHPVEEIGAVKNGHTMESIGK
jgi:hypothetical protein